MDRDTAKDRVKQDFVESLRLLGAVDIEPEQMKEMIDNVIERYEQYREQDEQIEEFL